MLKPSKFKKKRVKIDTKPETADIDEETHIELVVIPPDGGWGWIVVAASFMSNMVVDGTLYTFGIFLQDITNDFQSTESNVSWANSILTGFYYMCGPMVCALANRCGFRFVGIMGAIIGSSSMGIASIAPSLQIYIIVYGVLGGIGFALSYISNLLIVGFYFERWRALATAISVCGSSVGMIVFPPIFNIFLSDFTWRMKYRFLSVACLVIGLVSLTYKPIPPSKVYPQKDEDKVSILSSPLNEDNPKSIFYKRHNTFYPTSAELVQGSFTVLGGRDHRGPGPSNSATSVRTYMTYRTWLTKQSSFLSTGTFQHERRRRCCNSQSCYNESVQRPMYKDDILFTGSIATLPNYDRSRHERQQASLDYHMSVTRVATLRDLEEGQKCCVCCPQSVVRTLATMLDFTLLKTCSFFLLALSGYFTYLGCFIPFIYIIEFAESKHMAFDEATLLISAIGISNGIGRLCTGVVSFLPPHSALYITDVCLLAAGIATILVIFAKNDALFFFYAVIFGATTACLASLRPIMVVDLYGLDKLTNAVGIIVLFEGIAAMCGVPLAAILKEQTGSSSASFLFAGITITFSVFLLFPLKPLRMREIRKEENRERIEKARKQEETRKKLAQINKPGQKR